MFGLINRDTLPTSTADEFEHFTSSLKAWALKEHNEDGTHFVSTTTNVPLGTCLPYAGSSTPNSNWLFCDGSQVSRVTYQTLFNLVGTTYGAGDGSTTFNIPDLRQRFPLGKAAAGTGSILGSTGGTIDHTHSVASLTISGSTGSASPGTDSQGSHSHGGVTGSESSHTHSFSATTGAASAGQFVDLGATSSHTGINHTHDVSGTTGAGSSHSHSISSDGSHSHTVNSHTHAAGTLAVSGTEGTANPPYTVLNYIILAK
jgi:microcystin-dependent protein